MKDFLERLASDSPTPGGGSASAAAGAMGTALLSMVFLISRKKLTKALEKQRKEILSTLIIEREKEVQKVEGEDKVQKRERKYKVHESNYLYKEEKTQKILIEKFKKSADEAKKVMNELLMLINEDANAYENVLIKLRELSNLKTVESKVEIDSSEVEISGSEVEINNSKVKNNISKVESEINKAKEDLQKAYKHAAEVPFQIAKLCHKILINSKTLTDNINNAVKSDFQIAVLLLKTGIKGASLNVDINLNDIEDKDFVEEKRKELNKILKYLDQID